MQTGARPVNERGVFVTGGASGIGLAAARQLAADGWAVAVADRDAAGLERAEAELAEWGERVVRLTLDVTDEAAVAAAMAQAAERIGPLRGVVNSAGIAQNKPFDEITAAEFRRILDVNVVGSFLVARAAVAAMRATGGGAIVNIASISGMRGNLGRTAYGASKGGVITMTQVMAVELARDGIRVNAVSPGPVDTPMVRALHPPEYRGASSAGCRSAVMPGPRKSRPSSPSSSTTSARATSPARSSASTAASSPPA
jgi:NAD(P)-dependent dehydrogenase (short-subunit alcohol dehydrogenase family)